MENPSTSTLPPTTSTAAAFGKKWRDKLRTNKEKKQNAKLSVDEVVNDFLGTHRKGQNSNGNGADFVGSPPTDPPPYFPPKKPRRPGLTVSFDLGPPEVIGEGGEEADLPTKHIGLSRPSQQQPQELEESSDDPAPPADEEVPAIAVSGTGNDELGFSDWRPPLTTDTTLLRALSTAGTGGKRRSRLSMRMDDETAELARKIRAKMIEEEGRALHQKPPEEDEEQREVAPEARRSVELNNAQHETNIVSPQPRRVVAYRPAGGGSPLDSFTEKVDSQNGQTQEGNRIQDMISHLRDEEDTQPGDLGTTREDRLGPGSPPSSSGFLSSQPQQYQSYQKRSPSPQPETEYTAPVKQSSSKWKSTLSRANTTARPRLQPPVSESLLGRSLSMRTSSRNHADSNQKPSTVGWQKFQYQPASSPSLKQPSPKPLPDAPSISPPKSNGGLGVPPERSPLPSPQLATADGNESPIQTKPSISLLQDSPKESKSPTDQKSSLLNSLDSPVSSSTTTLPAYEPVASSKLLPQPQEEESAPQKNAPTAKKSWRTLTSAVTRDALADFSAGAEQYYSLFSLSVQDSYSAAATYREKGLVEWIRASVWWVLKGRNQLEVAIRQGGGITDLHQQGAVSLAKAWWINAEVVPKHAELIKLKHQVATSNGDASGSAKDVGTDVILNLARGLGDARLNSLITLHQAVSSHVRALATSMKRNNISLPPPDQLIKKIDLSIWVKYPYCGADVTALLSTLVPKTLRVDPRSKASDIDVGELLPFNDTTRFFSYGRMFVDAVLHAVDDDDDDYRREEEVMPCIVSLAREKQDWHVQAFIASQSGLINVVIQADKRQGPTWHDVRFDTRQCAAWVRLSRNWKLELKFTGNDGKMEFDRLWKMVDYSRTVEAGLNCEEHEEIVFEGVLKAFQYVGAPGAAGTPFPAEPTPRCRVRLFEKQVPMNENGGTRFAHMGFRLICVTSPKVKNLSSITHTFAHSAPIIFAHARSKDDGENSPILLVKLTNRQTGAPYQIRLTFHDSAEMLKLHTLLLNVHLAESEEKTPDIGLRSYSIDEPMTSGRSNSTFLPSLLAFPGQATGSAAKSGITVSVINTAKEFMEHGQSPAVMSNSLRLFTKCGWGSVTDRMNLGPGELKIALDPKSMNTFSLYRRGQHDLLISMADNLAPAEARETVPKFLKAAGSTPTIRRFQFNSLRDLHKFETALTGFDVLFDGLATSFAISRRRMVVPIYKKWEASGARLQILQQEKSIQLVAFFADFSHGKGMNFVVKGTDVFEIFNKGGKYGVRIVDAKFPLPKKAGQTTSEEERLDVGEEEFLSLDLPDFPSEHDDITITFDDEHAWKGFQTAVPGIIREQSRIGSLRH